MLYRWCQRLFKLVVLCCSTLARLLTVRAPFLRALVPVANNGVIVFFLASLQLANSSCVQQFSSL
uniref:Uncharacterized protein n=1 Tax=Physcomitrium patens TaxID=3218 RepID=A0A2K1JM24_PHYPA|nr:hypothetical protein PHYPA_017411 [Physcomitrium patens]